MNWYSLIEKQEREKAQLVKRALKSGETMVAAARVLGVSRQYMYTLADKYSASRYAIPLESDR